MSKLRDPLFPQKHGSSAEVIEFYGLTKEQEDEAWLEIEKVWLTDHRHRFYPYMTAHSVCAKIVYTPSVVP